MNDPASRGAASAGLTPTTALALASGMLRGVVCYELRPTEVLAVLALVLDTYLAGRTVSRADVASFARQLKGDGPGATMRQDKYLRLWGELVALGLVDHNAGQGTYQLRPAVELWSRARGLRVPVVLAGTDTRAQELPLIAERPLSDAMSALAREQALGAESIGGNGGNRGGPEDWRRLRQSLDGPAPAQGDGGKIHQIAVEKSTGLVEKFSASLVEKSTGAQRLLPEELAPPVEKSTGSLKLKLKLLKAKLSLKLTPGERSSVAWAVVEAADWGAALRTKQCRQQWERLCVGDPGYVVGRLAGALQDRLVKAMARGERFDSPLGYMAAKARGDGKMG